MFFETIRCHFCEQGKGFLSYGFLSRFQAQSLVIAHVGRGRGNRSVFLLLLFFLLTSSSGQPRVSLASTISVSRYPLLRSLLSQQVPPGLVLSLGDSKQVPVVIILHLDEERKKRNPSLGHLGILLCTVETLINQLGRCSPALCSWKIAFD